MDDFVTRATRVINGAFGGEHHVSSLKWRVDNWQGAGCSFIVHGGIMATYDYAGLTQLVVHCHDECVRAEIGNGGPGGLKITLSNRERKSRHPDSGAHPTLEQHVAQIRRGGNYQPLFDQLRIEGKP